MKILVITQKYDINDSNLGVFIDWWNRLAAKMEKELARLKVARKYKNIKQGLQIKIEDE